MSYSGLFAVWRHGTMWAQSIADWEGGTGLSRGDTEMKHTFWTKVANHFDSNGNGSINRVEFGAILVRLFVE